MKRVLIIAYYWPPAGGPGVQRWLHMVAHLPEFGIEPVLCIPQNPHYPTLDEGLLEQVPPDIEIIRRPIMEPYGLASLFASGKTKQISKGVISDKDSGWVERLLLRLRGNLFVPDARVGWVKPMARFWKKHWREHQIEAVVTTGPPHSLHLIGKLLRSSTGLPWLADFRDPWTEIHYHDALQLGKRAREKHKCLERNVLNEADMITVTSPSTGRSFAQLTDRPIAVVTNGFDGRNWKQEQLDSTFSIVHIGSLYSKRNPLQLWEELGNMLQDDPELASNLQLEFLGVVSEEVKASIRLHIPESNLKFRGYVPHEQALKRQRQARVLLLIEMNRPETRQIVPGKLFEYIQSKRPIMAVGPSGSDVAELLSEGPFGMYFNYGDGKGMRQFLEDQYKAFSTGDTRENTGDTGPYDRKQLAARMAEILLSLN